MHTSAPVSNTPGALWRSEECEAVFSTLSPVYQEPTTFVERHSVEIGVMLGLILLIAIFGGIYWLFFLAQGVA